MSTGMLLLDLIADGTLVRNANGDTECHALYGQHYVHRGGRWYRTTTGEPVLPYIAAHLDAWLARRLGCGDDTDPTPPHGVMRPLGGAA